MNSNDLQISQHVISALASKKYEKYNYLFLKPVDLTIFTTYTSIVKRPMDLGTVEKNLKKGIYQTKHEFLADITQCFDNAELFHRDKAENRWIIKYASKMKKNVNKEVKLATKNINGTASSSGTKNSATSSAIDGTGVTTASTSSGKKRLNISLRGANRISNNKSPSERSSDGTATPIERRKKKKQKTGDGGITSGGGDSIKLAPKPKLSLKLNKQPASQQPSNASTSQNTSISVSSAKTTSPPNVEKKNAQTKT